MFLWPLQGISHHRQEQLPFHLSCILGRGELAFHAGRGWILGTTICCCGKTLNLGAPDAGWWCHLPESTSGHELPAAFFCVTHFIPFSKKTPTAKTPSSFTCLFTYLGYLFVVPLVSDFLSKCPTHELCVYTKTWWCCERQRVSITSLTLSKDVFLGRLQAGPALLSLLQLSDITGDPGARGAGDGEPWWGWMARKWCHFPKKIPMPCVVEDAWTCCCAVILLRQSTAFPWMASPINSHMPQLFLVGAPTLSGTNDIWKHKSRGKLTLQLSSLICSHGGSSGRWIVQGQIPNGKVEGFLSSPQSYFYPHALGKKIFWLYHARTVSSRWFTFWKCGWSPTKMWAKSLQKSTTRRAGS